LANSGSALGADLGDAGKGAAAAARLPCWTLRSMFHGALCDYAISSHGTDFGSILVRF
jgi:hypothetical protein